MVRSVLDFHEELRHKIIPMREELNTLFQFKGPF